MKKLAILLLALSFACINPAKHPTFSAIVLEKHFVHAVHGSGIAPGVSSSGKVVVSFVTINEEEHYTLIVRDERGDFAHVDVPIEIYGRLKEGDSVRLKYWWGDAHIQGDDWK